MVRDGLSAVNGPSVDLLEPTLMIHTEWMVSRSWGLCPGLRRAQDLQWVGTVITGPLRWVGIAIIWGTPCCNLGYGRDAALPHPRIRQGRSQKQEPRWRRRGSIIRLEINYTGASCTLLTECLSTGYRHTLRKDISAR